MEPGLISVIIPAYNEGDTLKQLIDRLAGREVEIVVSLHREDWLSRETLKGHDVVLVEGAAGRGEQLAVGALRSSGDYLLFCHADTILPENFDEEVRRILSLPNVAGGAFTLGFSGDRPGMRMVASLANLRAHRLGLVYGDQCIFTTRKNYFEAGGVQPLPLMEDVDFICRLWGIGKVEVSPMTVLTSPRRYARRGIFFTVVRNAVLILLFVLGVSSNRLARFYR